MSQHDGFIKHYTEYRGEQPARDVVRDFGLQMAALVTGLEKGSAEQPDLHGRGRREASPQPFRRNADAWARLNDMMEEATSPTSRSQLAFNVMANVIADHKVSATIVNPQAPRDGILLGVWAGKEVYFDTVRAREGLAALADKLGSVGDAVGGEFGQIFHGIAALAKDALLLWGAFDPPTPPASPDDPMGGGEPGTGRPAAATAEAVDGLAKQLEGVGEEVNALEGKLDTLGDLLGRSLTGGPWVVDPRTPPSDPNEPASVTPTDLAVLLDRLLREVRKLTDPPAPTAGTGVRPPAGSPAPNPGPDPGPAPVPNPDPGGPVYPEPLTAPGATSSTTVATRCEQDPRTKLIFVYAEGTLTLDADHRRWRLDVETPAFDLTGWLDLSELNESDEVEVCVEVAVSDGPPRELATQRLHRRGLVPFSAITGGHDYLSGRRVYISVFWLRSSDDFSTPVSLRYQFVVESQPPLRNTSFVSLV